MADGERVKDEEQEKNELRDAREGEGSKQRENQEWKKGGRENHGSVGWGRESQGSPGYGGQENNGETGFSDNKDAPAKKE